MNLVPGRSWSGYLDSFDDVAHFGLLGPFVRGQILERVAFAVSQSATNLFELGAVLTSSSRAGVDGWGSGRPLIQRSTAVGDGQPILVFRTFGTMPFVFELGVGVTVAEGPLYVIWRVRQTVVSRALEAAATCYVWARPGPGEVDGTV